MEINKLTQEIIRFILLGICMAVTCNVVYSQSYSHVPSDHRGDKNYRAYSNLNGNQIRGSVFNSGYIGGPNEVPESIPYEWPKNSGQIYVSMIGIWLGGEVIDEEGRLTQIVELPVYRESPLGDTWNFEPVPGFLNPFREPKIEIANSNDESTWPPVLQGGWRDKKDDPVDPGWIGSWNGFFGKNIMNADQELFYRCSDDLYDRYNYIPDETDPTRHGLGLLMDVRALAWSQVLIQDVVFFIHDVVNDGTKRIPKSSFCIWIADWVGGDGEDDEPWIDIQTDIAFLTDHDRVGLPPEKWGDTKVGVAAIKYLETPGNQVDGIDNDGDADKHPELLMQIEGDIEVRAPHFTGDDFIPRELRPGDKIVLIDSLTFNRVVTVYPEQGGTVVSLGHMTELPAAGIILEEDTTANSIDEDLDGLIDERYTLHRWRYDEVTGIEAPVRYINYLSFEVGDTVKRGFIVKGKSKKPSFATVAPMIDESREDNFDNDADWNVFMDDVGLDGVRSSGDPGEGDGVPTSGASTDFPGEPNIDKTDVSETDLIGLTTAIQIPEGKINWNSTPDKYLWDRLMSPGNFYLPRPTGEYHTIVSSGFFPFEPGQRQRFAIAMAIAGGGQTKDDDIQSARDKLEYARMAYERDYQFARAPYQVTVTAVSGDREVTLYWDDIAEFSFDRYIEGIGGNGRDFEGYRIYRSTDAAFEDARVITDGAGIPTLLKPIAQFDLKDGITGYDPIGINGVRFYLGDDTGLVHSFKDTNVVNGQRYFYAVTAYDFGYPAGGIAPAETPISVDVDLRGNLKTGSNVAVVRPKAPAAGFLPPEVETFEHIQGGATGKIGINIIDAMKIKHGQIYEITFRDTVVESGTKEKKTTKDFTLTDITENIVLIRNSTRFHENEETLIVDGFQMTFLNDSLISLDQKQSGWNRSDVFPFVFDPVIFPGVISSKFSNDYQIMIGEIGIAASKDTSIGYYHLPSKEVNFQVMNILENRPVEFAFAELDGNDGRFTVDPNDAQRPDVIYLLEENEVGQPVYTWQISLSLKSNGENPQPGDTLTVRLKRPFLSSDVYRYKMKAASVSADLAKRELDDIRVVPNPYVAAETWEPWNTYTSGRGPREIHFINLPNNCTISIFNVNGTMIDKIEHVSAIDNGTAIWDVLSKENLEIAYGIYLYHIEAPGIGQKTGTFAIIK